MIRRPPRSTLFPTRRSSDLRARQGLDGPARAGLVRPEVDVDALELRVGAVDAERQLARVLPDRKSTRLNSSHLVISYAVFCLKKKKTDRRKPHTNVSIKRAL